MPIRKFLLFVVLIFISKISYSQTNSGTTKEQFPFYDNFANNRNGWPVQSGAGYTFSFSSRKYDMNSAIEIYISPVVNTLFDHERDYSITGVLNHISGPSENPYGLTFSYKSSGNEYQFEISTQGYYRVIRAQDNNITQIIQWTQSDAIKKEEKQSNRLKISKKGTTCELYINDVKVNSFDDFENEGDYTGFVIENKQHVQVSLLVIQYD